MTAAKRGMEKGPFRFLSPPLHAYSLSRQRSTKRVGKESTKSKSIKGDQLTGARVWNVKRTVQFQGETPAVDLPGVTHYPTPSSFPHCHPRACQKG